MIPFSMRHSRYACDTCLHLIWLYFSAFRHFSRSCGDGGVGRGGEWSQRLGRGSAAGKGPMGDGSRNTHLHQRLALCLLVERERTLVRGLHDLALGRAGVHEMTVRERA
jgi:hypothetical protein